MSRKRLLVETTRAGKATLDDVLSHSQLTLADWFDAKLNEEAAAYGEHSAFSQSADGGIRSLEEIRDPQAVLRHLKRVDWAFENDDTGYLSHDLHPYPAKFIPQIPGTLIPALTLCGELVWDPFGGSGTTALEASLLRRRALSSDANPLSVVIGEAKTTTLSKEDEDALAGLHDRVLLLSRESDPMAVIDRSERADLESQIPRIPNIHYWFSQNAIHELAMIKMFCGPLPAGARAVSLVAFSKTVLKASFQDGETRYARKDKEVLRGAVLRSYAGELKAAAAKVRRLGNRLRFRKPRFAIADARSDIVGPGPPAIVAPESVALVVGSPPYPNANDYHLYHRFRLFWLGYDPRSLGAMEIGSHLRHQREQNGIDAYLREMRSCLRNCFLALQTGRYAVFVIGDCVYNGQTYNTGARLAELARGVGFEEVGTVRRSVHGTKRSFIPPARRTRTEALLVLRKPCAPVRALLDRPPYRLWPYEDRLREEEVKAVAGRPPTRLPTGQLAVTLDPYEVDRLRRLTFTHLVESSGCGRFLTWQAILENGEVRPRTARKDPKYAAHGIHPYKGKFYPQLAKALFNLAGLSPASRVLDPYCGSGTVLLEAQLNGFKARGCDINPLAVEIANAKCGILAEDPVIVDRLLACFLERLRSAENSYSTADLSPFPPKAHEEITRWFPPRVIGKLAWCLKEVDRAPVMAVKTFLKSALSSIVRDVSQQEPKDLRIRRRTMPLSDAPVFELMRDVLQVQRRRLRDFAERSDTSPHRMYAAHALLADARDPDAMARTVSDVGAANAMITSPPYATALPYIDTNRLSLLLLWGMTSADRAPVEQRMIGSREISLRRRRDLERMLADPASWNSIGSGLARQIVLQLFQQNGEQGVGFRRRNMAALIFRYFADMSMSLRNAGSALAPGASIFIVIGDNWTETGRGMVKIRTTDVLPEIGEALGWRLRDRIPITVTKEGLLHSHHSITENTVLWFSKP